MALIDCAQLMEPHWAWDSYPLVSQAYAEGDEFQEFGLKWAGRGFTYSSAPAWMWSGAATLDDMTPDTYASVATIVDLSALADRNGCVTPGDFIDAIGMALLRPILILRTGHADNVPMRRREYFSDCPGVAPAIAEMAAERGVRHLCVDFPCDSIASMRTDGTAGIANPNENLRRRAHANGLVVTENLRGLRALDGLSETFFFAMPLRGEGLTTAPCRPVAMTEWPSDAPVIRDISTPLMNHWRWRMELWETQRPDVASETHFVQTGHGYSHCDAPRHMEHDGKSMQQLPNSGLDLFIGGAAVIDLSDIKLPSPITLDLIKSRAGKLGKGRRIILRSDLTNRLGYRSTQWHTHAPNLEVPAAEWLVSHDPAAICLDFPQDEVAREMPGRHVYNREFVTHHAVLGAGVPFVEDLRDLGAIKRPDPFIAGLPLKMTCVDGAPMRVFALEW